MVTTSLDKIDVPDSDYIGIWKEHDVTIPFENKEEDIVFQVNEFSDKEIEVQVFVANGFAFIW